MESSRGHGRALNPSWTPGHNFSLAGCFPWPHQRSSSSSCYTCGYCRREFRSAQALGGHMNVHRRDRARLRQCCPAPYVPSSSLPTPSLLASQQHRAPLPNLNYSPPHCAAAPEPPPVIYSFFSTTTSTSMVGVATKATLEVSLELGIGVCGRGGEAVEEEGLDLELRLGCA
ncbi:hypothetical protein HU200_063993 [Digitaria exilis]|uniref:C2H2-type domain-containing protein n=1 Tax=Digitaria exilis TaxID=1010633 RepID=A0A835A6I3_9POAL|nr:hypothetical protein HU200_063993 [Digitaria exilis]CAB3486484.1 unnamed protein product [Digitaria exilis]